MWTVFDVASKKTKIENLKKETENPDFWKNTEKAKSIQIEISNLEKEVKEWSDFETETDELLEMVKIGESESDEKILEEASIKFKTLEAKFAKSELQIYLSGKYDSKNAIVSIHAGQGGTEAMDWVSMLMRMYMRFCERREWKTETFEYTAGEEAGIKSVTFSVSGRYAYGYLKGEAGTHRLVRQSPFNADKLRQTSFALVEVMPELEETDVGDINIKDEDLDWQFIHAGGHGGQNVNKVSTKVELHFDVMNSKLLTNEQKNIILSKLKHHINKEGILKVTIQETRSQFDNKEIALKKFHSFIASSFQKTKKRIRTKATKSSKEKRIQQKKRKGEIKKLRREKW